MSESGKLILVIDDEVDICELMADRLEMEGYKTRTAKSGNVALAILSETPEIDLIITDVRMPDGDGIKVLEENQKIVPKRPVIIITGFSDFAEDQLKSMGAFAVISKPINYEELLAVISQSLN